MTFEQIRYTIDGPIATIMLARPEKMNAYTAVMGAELAEAVRKAGAEEKVRVIILTGEGRGFWPRPAARGGQVGSGPHLASGAARGRRHCGREQRWQGQPLYRHAAGGGAGRMIPGPPCRAT